MRRGSGWVKWGAYKVEGLREWGGEGLWGSASLQGLSAPSAQRSWHPAFSATATRLSSRVSLPSGLLTMGMLSLLSGLVGSKNKHVAFLTFSKEFLLQVAKGQQFIVLS